MSFSHKMSHRINECTPILSVWRLVHTYQSGTKMSAEEEQEEFENIKQILDKGQDEYTYMIHQITTNDNQDSNSKDMAIRLVYWVNHKFTKRDAHSYNPYNCNLFVHFNKIQ